MRAYRLEIIIGVVLIAATLAGYAIDPTVPVAVVAIAALPYALFFLSRDPVSRGISAVKGDESR